MNGQQIDRTLLLLGGVLILFSSYQLFWVKGPEVKGPVLGTITAKRSVVKSKGTRGLDWQDAYINGEVSNNQLIFTDAQSSAEITLHSGPKISVEENSLIRIQEEANLETLDLRRGHLETSLAGVPLRVRLGDREVTLDSKNALVQISQTNEGSAIGVLSGDVKVSSNGVVEGLDASRALHFEGSAMKVKNISLQTSAPDRGAELFVEEDSRLIRFGWEPQEIGEVRLEDSRGQIIPVLAHEARLSPGTYRWRVIAPDGESLESNFKVTRVLAPEILRPKDGEGLRLLPLESGEGRFRLQWTSQTEESVVEWEVEGQRKRVIALGEAHEVGMINSGEFRWRVSSRYADERIEAFSPWQTLRVELVSLPGKPQGLTPEGVEYQFYNVTDEVIPLRWTGTSKSELSLRAPGKEAESVFTDEASHDYAPEAFGEHRWRVRGIDEFGRPGPWSDEKTFTVTDLSQFIDGEAQKIQLERPDQEVEFSWEDSGGASLFEISRDVRFKDHVLTKKIDGTSTKVRVPEVGVYYWRSQRMLPDGRLERNPPRRVIIEPTPAPEKPKPLPEKEIPLKWKSVQGSFIDFLLPRAFADDATGEIRISLPAHENAKSYLVRILSSSGTEIFSAEVPGTEFLWKRARPGEYLWQYAIKDHWGRQSEFSDPSKLIIQQPEIRRALLSSPIRGEKVSGSEVRFHWSKPSGAQGFTFELSDQEDFKNILHGESVSDEKTELTLPEEGLASGDYFWRVRSDFPDGRSRLSSTGRFSFARPSPEKTNGPPPLTFPELLLSVLWKPSMDTFAFKDGAREGEIEGNNFVSTQLQGLHLRDRFFGTGSGSFSRGKVFDGEDYTAMELTLSGGYLLNLNNNRLGLGLRGSYLRSSNYSVTAGKVTSETESSLRYGPEILGLIPWERRHFLFTGAYLFGEITEFSASVDLISPWKDFYFSGGVGRIQRSFSENSGELRSLSLRLGVGKSF